MYKFATHDGLIEGMSKADNDQAFILFDRIFDKIYVRFTCVVLFAVP